GTGTGASATAVTDGGAITAVAVTDPGAGYLTPGMRKFVDDLPTLCSPADCPDAGKYLPTAVPDVKRYTDTSVTPSRDVAADEYVIGLVQYRTSFSSDLPPTLVRGYVQLDTGNTPGSKHVALENELLDGTKTPVLVNGVQAYGVTPPQYLGPFIAATKNKPTRIVFRNLLPTGADGDLFLPVDSSMMGSGMGPMGMTEPTDSKATDDAVRDPECTKDPKSPMCFKDNRATLHLHGGTTPWISDGTPHQWITPAGEDTPWPQGVSVQNVPDMKDAAGLTTCDAADDGCQTFFYTNQQSARLMFYHDHAWGITRLNVYAGEAAGYLIADDTEKKLVADGTIPSAADTLPLIIQDKTFVPGDEQLKDVKDGAGKITSYGQDPTWDSSRWGSKGSLWYHHVYMPAQNPGDASGMSAYGRWMYGPWFWPPASGTKYGAIPNPYYDAACKVDVPSTWQYQTDPFCEPELIPGTPNISAGMEQFNDTPLVNGVAYPKVTLQPKPYRLRMLNAANDRFFNLQWYTADADPANGNGKTEVKLNPAELLAAQTDPNVSPTPADAHNDASGPDWVQFANEGGFLPTPTVIDGQQPTTWITDPTRFDVGNVDQHSMLLAPAERADAVVDFSKFAGKTLILYNDAPAAFPARVPGYDYYTGAPDLSPTGAPTIFPGYGPNTRTVMQVTIANTTPAPAFNVTALKNAFAHKANGSGVFESSQHPPIVGQAAYNSAMGSSFAATGECKAAGVTKCDGLVRVNDTGSFTFNTLKSPATKTTVKMEPKAIHDETNSSTFDEFGRMQANLGIEAEPPTPGAQNVTLYPFVNPQTELIDGTNLPKQVVTTDSVTGEPVSDVKISPISDAKDGTQIWRVTHNGVDTHPIHFHLYDVQVLNRVTWDNIIIPNDANENGWKDTVRMSPLEDTIVALRPIIPQVPFEVPNSVRPLNPMMPSTSGAMFFNTDPQGNPLATPITNKSINFGWEYVWHCHILSHEEMDMMRPVSLALPPIKPDGLASTFVNVLDKNGKVVGQNVKLTWNDNSITETRFVVKRTTDGT
ncbi:MAG TPA: multicopper oxidase domain-containing protein, partial [Ornithinibacter sp.]|nr:multicopper oxidase domain-containing protein [Ornithinibacter sp.]